MQTRTSLARVAASLLIALMTGTVAACDGEHDGDTDGGRADSGLDGGSPEAGVDGGTPDGGRDARPTDTSPDAGPTPDSGPPNRPPVARLAYEIILNEWVDVHDGDTVVRPLDADINWLACSSSDPDGAVIEIRLENGLTTTLLGPTVACGEHTETDHSPRRDYPARLRVWDDDGAETVLRFTYRTE